MTPGYFRRAMCPTTLRRALVPEPAMHHRSSCLALLLVMILSACTSTPNPTAAIGPSLEGDALRPAAASGWIRSELYFGVGRDDAPSDRPNTDTIDEAAWRRFLDQEVTPRFPDGLRSEEHTSELQSRENLVCRLLLEKKKKSHI